MAEVPLADFAELSLFSSGGEGWAEEALSFNEVGIKYFISMSGARLAPGRYVVVYAVAGYVGLH